MSSVEKILASLPCSIELPAGTGKTETIASLVETYAAQGRNSLVLTHTHAGVDVLRRRLKKRGVSSKHFVVKTLDSWCFDLIRSFPLLAGIVVGEEPDWDLHQKYHEAGALSVLTDAVVKMLKISHDLLIVDEYQDCQLHQHDLVTAMARTLPAVVFGDRMQGLFFWSGNSVIWERDVMAVFPPISIDVVPWRWKKSNLALGEWSLSAREDLMNGVGIDLVTSPLQRFAVGEETGACHAAPHHPETAVAIANWPKSAAVLSSRLGGSFTMIEELEGRHLKVFAKIVDGAIPGQIAQETLAYAISCSSGVAPRFSASARGVLARGGLLSARSFPGAEGAVFALNGVIADPSPRSVRVALQALRDVEGVRLFRREAWFGIVEALRICESTPGLPVHEAVVLIRNKISITGRGPESRIVGRPLLVKGLEFDHAVITEADQLNAHELYVALTRGSSSVGIVTDALIISPPRPYVHDDESSPTEFPRPGRTQLVPSP